MGDEVFENGLGEGLEGEGGATLCLTVCLKRRGEETDARGGEPSRQLTQNDLIRMDDLGYRRTLELADPLRLVLRVSVRTLTSGFFPLGLIEINLPDKWKSTDYVPLKHLLTSRELGENMFNRLWWWDERWLG